MPIQVNMLNDLLDCWELITDPRKNGTYAHWSSTSPLYTGSLGNVMIGRQIFRTWDPKLRLNCDNPPFTWGPNDICWCPDAIGSIYYHFPCGSVPCIKESDAVMALCLQNYKITTVQSAAIFLIKVRTSQATTYAHYLSDFRQNTAHDKFLFVRHLESGIEGDDNFLSICMANINLFASLSGEQVSSPYRTYTCSCLTYHTWCCSNYACHTSIKSHPRAPCPVCYHAQVSDWSIAHQPLHCLHIPALNAPAC